MLKDHLEADLVILDEFDQMNEDVLANAIPRLRSSRVNFMRITSTPTIPEFGSTRCWPAPMSVTTNCGAGPAITGSSRSSR